MSLNSVIFAGLAFFITISILFSQNKNPELPKVDADIKISDSIAITSTPTKTHKKISTKIAQTVLPSTENKPINIISVISPSISTIFSPKIENINPIISTTTAPSLSPAPVTPSMTPIATSIISNLSHTYYTSSHWKSKYYYCDTDDDWKNLSEAYIKKYSDINLLLGDFPGKILHEPCKQ